jgi:hypothetical protein
MLAAGTVSFSNLNWKDIIFCILKVEVLVWRDQKFWKCCDVGSKEGSEIFTRI